MKVLLPGNDITYVEGTSVASAFVAGAAALLLSHNPEMSPGEVRERIVSSATRLDSLDGKCAAQGILNIESMMEVEAWTE